MTDHPLNAESPEKRAAIRLADEAIHARRFVKAYSLLIPWYPHSHTIEIIKSAAQCAVPVSPHPPRDASCQSGE